MKRIHIYGLVAALGACVMPASFAANPISVSFDGRDQFTTANPAHAPVPTASSAGVLSVPNWNSLDDQYNADGTIPVFNGANNGTTGPLNDSSGAVTVVTLTFAANDSWDNDTNPTNFTSGNAIMMNGIIKEGGVNNTAAFTFNNLTDGQYDVYAYVNCNADARKINLFAGDYLSNQQYYGAETHHFYDPTTVLTSTNDANSFIQITNTDPAGVRTLGNYVKFSSVPTYGKTSLTINVQNADVSDGIGVAGLQIINVGGPVPPTSNTTPPTIVTQPVGGQRIAVGSTAAMSVVAHGPLLTYQWYKNATLIPGATSASYTTPPLTAGDNLASFYAVVGNNVSSVQSSNYVVTIGTIALTTGYLFNQYYPGASISDLLDPGFTTPPTISRSIPFFETPVNQGDTYSERVSGYFTPPVTGDYVFFVCSDDNSSLYLSTDNTAANMKLIAQETAWSNNRQWTNTSGGSDLPSKRSDQFTTTEWPTPDPVNGGAIIHLTNGVAYYIEGIHNEGGGGDDFSATYILSGSSDPLSGSATALTGSVISSLALDGAYINITSQPQGTTIPQNTTATFTIAATSGYIGDTTGAAVPITYQWQEAPPGSSTFTNIPGASGTPYPAYVTPTVPLSQSGLQFRVVLSVPGGTNVTSAVAVLTVNQDVVPPTLVSAASLSGSTNVGIAFNEQVDSVSGSVAANYSIAGATITAAVVRTNDPTTVSLTLAAPLSGSTFTAVVNNVKDLANNPIAPNSSVSGAVLKLISQNIGDETVQDGAGNVVGDPALPGSAFTAGAGSFDIKAGGSDIYNTGDGFRFTYETKTNDFDVVVRVVSVVPINNWSAGALMVRETLDFQSRDWHTKTTIPSTVSTIDGGTGANSIETNRRDTTAGSTAGWVGNTAGNYHPAYPNTWLRLARVGNTFNAYYSTNGTDWNQTASEDPTTTGDATPFPAVTYVGMASTAHDNLNAGVVDPTWETTVVYRNYNGNYVASTPPATITLSPPSGNSITVSWSPAGGRLQSTPALGASAVWTDVGTVNPATVSLTGSQLFLRVINP